MIGAVQTSSYFTPCALCGGAFYRPPSRLSRKCCSFACGRRLARRLPEVRFWAKVNKDGSPPIHCPEIGACWIWTAKPDRDGYGHLRLGDPYGAPSIQAHVFSFALHYGPRHLDLWVLHHCDRPSCVNPQHLYAGTSADNVRDRTVRQRSASGDKNGSRLHPELLPRGDLSFPRLHRERMARGEGNGRSTLTESLVREIRSAVAAGMPSRKAAVVFKTSRSAVRHVVSRRSWGHVE